MVTFTVKVENAHNQHQVSLQTGDHRHTLTIAPKPGGYGSSMNGGEALLLAIATCYCNDLYREAERVGMPVSQVTVAVDGRYDGVPGHPITDIIYHVSVEADAPEAEIAALIRSTDRVAEIHNTLREGASVTLGEVQPLSR